MEWVREAGVAAPMPRQYRLQFMYVYERLQSKFLNLEQEVLFSKHVSKSGLHQRNAIELANL